MVVPENWGVPEVVIESSTPAHNATGVPIGQTITLNFSMPLLQSTATDTNITLPPGNPARVTTPDPVDFRKVEINPNANLSPATLYTVQMTTNVRGMHSSHKVVPSAASSISFTTA